MVSKKKKRRINRAEEEALAAAYGMWVGGVFDEILAAESGDVPVMESEAFEECVADDLVEELCEEGVDLLDDFDPPF